MNKSLRRCKIKCFFIGAVTYSLIEILWRGYTHWTMALTGGLAMLLLFGIYRFFEDAPLLVKCVMGAGIITVVEFLAGIIINRELGLGVWSYEGVNHNILGQICPLFTFFWFLLCFPAFGICKFITSRFNKISI